MGESVWLLWFEQEQEAGEDTELLIGLYRTEEAARGAIVRLKDQAGFKDYPEASTSIPVLWTRFRGPRDSSGCRG